MGLQSPDPVLLAAHDGQAVTTAGGLVIDGSVDDPGPPPVSTPTEDGDADGVVNEVDPALVDHLEVYLLNYCKPGTYIQNDYTEKGFADMAILSRHQGMHALTRLRKGAIQTARLL